MPLLVAYVVIPFIQTVWPRPAPGSEGAERGGLSLYYRAPATASTGLAADATTAAAASCRAR